MARTYIIGEICGDWALQIREPGHPHQFLYFNSKNNADLVKSILEWEDAHPNKAVPYNLTLTPPNEWVSRVLELDELYTKLQTVTGFTAEQLLEIFKAGYTLEKPDYSKSFEEMARLAETIPPNEPLTCKGCMYAPDLPYEIHCRGCARLYTDHYRRPPEEEV